MHDLSALSGIPGDKRSAARGALYLLRGLIAPDYTLIAGADVTAKWQGFSVPAIQSLTLRDKKINRETL
ncbi:hypothetical protein QQF64_002891 [Cirrhinus molitorella]|uniref:Uncharacterized protein n=1 Tax=Cirrhinus molitorella TaxID=172907 RepID=A0ABR3MRG4_9TELE